MLKVLLTSLSLLISVSVSAGTHSDEDVLTCVFTEPFFTITFKQNSGDVRLSDPTMYHAGYERFGFEVIATDAKVIMAPNFSLTHKNGEPGAALLYQLVDGAGEPILELELSSQGSDGMSDKIYPFDAVYVGPNGNLQGQIGGCETSHLRSRLAATN